MQLGLVGINYNTAPLAVREKASINFEKLGESLSSLRRHTHYGIILSTCNRTEIYTSGSDSAVLEKAGLRFLGSLTGDEGGACADCIYILKNIEAAKHLFRVAAGLESMVVGEYEILGQVGQALDAAAKAGMADLLLNHVFQGAIQAGRRVREETGISRNALSISSIAVNLAEEALGKLSGRTMLVIGAGEAGRLVVKVARDRGVSRIAVASRTHQRAAALVQKVGGTPVGLDCLPQELSTADIVVTCAGAPHRMLGTDQIEKAMQSREGRPIVIIDIALPRNVDPEVGNITNVSLRNIDDLTSIYETNREGRLNEIGMAEGIVEDEMMRLAAWWKALEVRPLVSALMAKAEEIRDRQFGKTLRKLRPLSAEEQESLEAMTKSIVNKILKDPIQYLKADGDGEHARLIGELFQLDAEQHK
ncbi:MAG: glutamyl-tRNA reductase [Dehalococcoidia bacterium]|jgi:glutamyl-tRNA reductase